ncbi:MAG: hypothetical protein G8D81_19815 [gamma proteobacterium symbiont of Clathrolucina costata]
MFANAEAAGGVALEWGKGAAAQDLNRIRLVDADKLADWLGMPRARAYADRIAVKLDPQLKDAPKWLRDAYADALGLWRLGKIAFKIRADETESAVSLFRVARAVSLNEQEDLDLRRFSVRLLNDSKVIERLLTKLAPLLRCNPEWEPFNENAELFRLLGLEKFPPPIYLKGPLVINYSDVVWDASALRPYVGLSPDGVSEIKFSRRPTYLLTIENVSSFQRHVREVDDDGIVIYSAGFLSPALMQILVLLDMQLDKSCPCYHWGDRDVGGLRIFAHIESGYKRHKVVPHLMSMPSDKKVCFTKKERTTLEKLACEETEAGLLARVWFQKNLGPMEQEALDPLAPL